MLHSLWNYRHFIKSSILSEARGRFARSRLGGLWFILLPLAQALIFALVLSEIMRAKLPGVAAKGAYPAYLLAGTAAWTLFSEILNRSLTVFIDNANALKKIAFPRLCLPIIIAGGAFLNHGLMLLAIALVFAFLGYYPHWAWLAVPIAAIVAAMLAFGIGLLLGAFNVFARDVGHVMGIAMGLWFWLTPIVYPVSILPESVRPLVELNPMTPIARVYQDALTGQRWPDLLSLAYPVALGLVVMGLALFVFRRASPEMVDAL